jgi:excinuclease ABC subunit A
VIAEGTPEHVAGVPESHTGRFLAEVLEPEAERVSA